MQPDRNVPEKCCPACAGRGWNTAGGNDPSACGRCEAGELWHGDGEDAVPDTNATPRIENDGFWKSFNELVEDRRRLTIERAEALIRASTAETNFGLVRDALERVCDDHRKSCDCCGCRILGSLTRTGLRVVPENPMREPRWPDLHPDDEIGR